MIAEVRAALAAAVDTISGVRSTPYVTDQINGPQAIVDFRQIDYDLVMGRGADIYNVTIGVYAQRTSERSAQILLDTLREPSGATSLKTVVEADTGVAALVDYVRVRTASPIQIATIGTVDYLVVEFEIEVCV